MRENNDDGENSEELCMFYYKSEDIQAGHIFKGLLEGEVEG